MQYGDLVTVVMPIFNRAHLVPQIVGSLCAQSYHNLEILIVDDCSTDDVAGAVAALDDPRIKLIRRVQNGGVAAARNTGVDAATADLIAFLDSDDICVPQRIEISMRKLLSLSQDHVGVYSARLIYHDVTESNYKSMQTYIRPGAHETPLSGDLSARTQKANVLNFPTLLVKKAALIAAGPLDPLLRQNEDWDLCLRLTQQGPFGFIPEPLLLTPTSLDPSVRNLRVSRSHIQGARSFARITGKLKKSGCNKLHLAEHYMTTARHMMRVGKHRFGRRYLRAALALDPVKPKAWAHYLFSYVPALHAKLRKPLRA